MEKNCMNRIMNWARYILGDRCEGGKVFCLLGFGIWIGFCPTGQAVIIVTGNGTGNTTAPSDDPGWNYVGRINTGVVNFGYGVYLGGFNHNGSYSHWVLTAAHVGDGRFTVRGSSYEAVPNSLVHIQNPTSTPDDPFGLQTLSTYTDLAVFQIQVGATHNLPASKMPIGTLAPPLGSEVVGISGGRNRQSTQTAWDSSWSEVALTSTNAAYTGYKYGSGSTKRWGKNRVENTPLTTTTNNVNGDQRDVKVITMDFDESGVTRNSYGAVTHEFQAAPGDSGGGLFYKTGGAWELTGIFTTIGKYQGQSTTSAVFGNLTDAANLSLYRANILAVVPEPSSVGLAFGLFALAFAAFHRFHRRQQTATSPPR